MGLVDLVWRRTSSSREAASLSVAHYLARRGTRLGGREGTTDDKRQAAGAGTVVAWRRAVPPARPSPAGAH